MYVPSGHRPGLGQVNASRGAIAQALVRTEPYRGAPHTIENIHRAVNAGRKDASGRAVVEDICKGLYAKDYLSEAAASYYATCRGTRYMRDPATVELVKEPHLITRTRAVDCDEQTALIATLLGHAGIGSVEYTTVGFQPGAETHVFVTFPDPRGSGRRVVLDPVAGPTTATMLRRVKHVRRYSGF